MPIARIDARAAAAPPSVPGDAEKHRFKREFLNRFSNYAVGLGHWNQPGQRVAANL